MVIFNELQTCQCVCCIMLKVRRISVGRAEIFDDVKCSATAGETNMEGEMLRMTTEWEQRV